MEQVRRFSPGPLVQIEITSEFFMRGSLVHFATDLLDVAMGGAQARGRGDSFQSKQNS